MHSAYFGGGRNRGVGAAWVGARSISRVVVQAVVQACRWGRDRRVVTGRVESLLGETQPGKAALKQQSGGLDSDPKVGD